ncbi:hypothetical protein GCM10027612_04360 [Microbispora bryophytorum subsp. camponoti]
MVALARRLTAPAPGWTVEADAVVIGSGIAGLTVALRHVELDPRARVLVVTKDVLSAGSTRWAQGGIAAVLDPEDTPDEHLRDTLVAGVGLCDEEAVRVLVTEGPDALKRLMSHGAEFDRDTDGELQLTREGGHHRNRIVHAGGDATGAEVQRALAEAVLAEPRIEVIEHALALDLLLDAEGRACGVTLHVMGEGARDGVGAVRAGAVVLASGGMGQVYAATTNPVVSTGDGVALALRAGAVVRDIEFVQFHPTVLWLGEGSTGQQPLVSEAVRGEGAVLIDSSGERFMRGCTSWPTSRPATWSPRRSCVRWRRSAPTTSTSTPPTSARRSGGPGSPPSSPSAASTASTPSPSPSPSPPPPTTRAAACAPTCTAGPACPACTPVERRPARACTAPTGWPPTPCWKGSSTASASPPIWRPET